MLSGFKAFIMRGNVVDLAVAVIIGAAFTKIVTSVAEDVITPAIGALIGGADFSRYFILLGDIPATFTGDPTSYSALKAAGVAMIGYGTLLTAAVQFLLVAFIIYIMISLLKKAMPAKDAPKPEDPADIALLREIRDELRASRGIVPPPSN